MHWNANDLYVSRVCNVNSEHFWLKGWMDEWWEIRTRLFAKFIVVQLKV